MKSRNVIVLSLLATVLLCSVFSLAAAADDGDTVPPPIASDSVVSSNDNQQSPPDNSTQNLEPIYEDENGEPAFHALDNQTATDGNLEPGSAEDGENLIAPAPQTGAALDNSVIAIVVGAAVVVAVVLAAVGMVYYRRRAAKEES
jgi:hypothetical protein